MVNIKPQKGTESPGTNPEILRGRGFEIFFVWKGKYRGVIGFLLKKL